MNWIYNGEYFVYQAGGKLPIGNRKLYKYAVEIYQSFVDKGVTPQATLDFTNLVIAEGGWGHILHRRF